MTRFTEGFSHFVTSMSTTIRLDPERHDRLRTLAFHARRSMHSMLVEGVDLMLAKHKG